jgi:hypothetical protein
MKAKSRSATFTIRAKGEKLRERLRLAGNPAQTGGRRRKATSRLLLLISREAKDASLNSSTRVVVRRLLCYKHNGITCKTGGSCPNW